MTGLAASIARTGFAVGRCGNLDATPVFHPGPKGDATNFG
jgi:hypothetical protein